MALDLLTTTAFERDLRRVRKQGKIRIRLKTEIYNVAFGAAPR